LLLLRFGLALSLPYIEAGADNRRIRAMIDTREINGKHVLLAFAAGAAAGAVAAYLTAPRTGKEMRAAIKTWAHDTGEKAAAIPHALRHAKEAFAESYRGDNGHPTHT
jgi:hypothetical protein